jgi:Beta-ketoacyl synthase, N-terminal domain
MLATLETALEVDGNTGAHTTMQPVLGLFTLMRLIPPGTELRTDTSRLWMACAAVVARKLVMLSLLPPFPHQSKIDACIHYAIVHRTGIIIGGGSEGLWAIKRHHAVSLELGPDQIWPFFFPMALPNMPPGQVAIYLGARGSNFCVTAACAAATYAIGDAFKLV